MPERLLSMQDVLIRVSLSETEVYRRINAGSFPKPTRLGPQRIAFVEREIDEWITDQSNSTR